MSKLFCVEFQSTIWNSTQNILPIHWRLWSLYNIEILKEFLDFSFIVGRYFRRVPANLFSRKRWFPNCPRGSGRHLWWSNSTVTCHCVKLAISNQSGNHTNRNYWNNGSVRRTLAFSVGDVDNLPTVTVYHLKNPAHGCQADSSQPLLGMSLLTHAGINSLRPRQMAAILADDIFKWIFLNENVITSLEISLKSVPKGPINNIPALVQIMAWRRPGDKPVSEPMMVSLLTHICVTRPRWVKVNNVSKRGPMQRTRHQLCICVRVFIVYSKHNGAGYTIPVNTWRNNNVVIASKRRHFDVITSKWRRFGVITTSLLRNVFAGIYHRSNFITRLSSKWICSHCQWH